MEEILVIKPSSLGDIVHALVVVESLRRQRGNVRVTWLSRDIFAPLLETCPTVDRVIRYRREGGLREIARVGSALRRERFDLVLDMQGLARSAFWARCAPAPRKIGRGDGREFSRLAFRELAPPPEKGFKRAHAVEILLQFLRPLGLAPEIRGEVSFPRAKLSESVRRLLAPDGGDFPAPILLFPDSRRPEKEWRGFRELTSLLLAASAPPQGGGSLGRLVCSAMTPRLARQQRLWLAAMMLLAWLTGVPVWQVLLLLAGQCLLQGKLRRTALDHGGLSGDFLGADIELAQLWFLLALL